MTTNELLSLANAGFSRNEILYLAGVTAPAPAPAIQAHAQAAPPVIAATYPQAQTAPAPAAPAPAAPAVPPTVTAPPVAPQVTAQNQPALQQTAQLQQLLSGVDLPPAYDLDRNLQDFYRGLIYGEQPAPPDNITNPSLK